MRISCHPPYPLTLGHAAQYNPNLVWVVQSTDEELETDIALLTP
jgi:hypothetical protein